MFGSLRYSFTIVASLGVLALGSGPALGQMPESRVIRAAPNGDVFVADPTFNAVHVLRIAPDGGKPARDEIFAAGLKQPFGIAFYPVGSDPRWVYIAYSDGVVRFRYRNGQLKAAGKPEPIMAWIPPAHAPREVWNRTVGVAMAGNGSLFMTENDNGAIWRVAYLEGTRIASGGGDSAQSGYDAAKGRDLYMANCSACHLPNGEGVPGAFPPLKGSGVVNKDDAAKHIQVVLNGMQGGRAGGVVYASAMPPFAGLLSDAEIADIIDYERNSWGNHGAPVNAAQVAAERARPR